jgi:small subunit ribosomal protein S21|tara:strand:+ start:155 stop:415 length:261 start_codon:yes stop_codon:yes gene_type:complete
MSKSKAKVSVEVRKGDINRALKIFKRRGFDSGHIQELKDRKEYTKPTTSKRRQKQKAIYLQKLKTIEDNDVGGGLNETTDKKRKRK